MSTGNGWLTVKVVAAVIVSGALLLAGTFAMMDGARYASAALLAVAGLWAFQFMDSIEEDINER